MMDFLYMILSAMVVENLVFARGLGTSHLMEKISTYTRIRDFSFVSFVVTSASGAIAWIVINTKVVQKWQISLKYIVIFFCIVVVYLIFISIYSKLSIRDIGDDILISSVFNTGVFGAVMLAISHKYNFFGTVGYCMGASLGMAFAMLLIHAGKERMDINDVPKVFEGLPITLVYIGILSLAIYGLIGHQLPT